MIQRHRRRRLPGLRALGAALLCAPLLLVGGCGSEPGNSWPAGTVAVVDGIPISAASVDAHVEALLLIEPGFTEGHRRRLLLTHSSIPKAYGIAHAGDARAQARADAEAWLASESSGPAPVTAKDLGLYEQGHWGDIGLETWLVARNLDPGQSSGIVELTGRYAVIKMISRDGHPDPLHEFMRVAVHSFPYVSDPSLMMTKCLEGTLEIVDPEWDRWIPQKYKYAMRGEQ